MAERDGPVVLVVGSLQQDIVVHCARLPQAGEQLTGGPWRPVFGGKGGLQALAAARTGRARLVAALGKDSFADFLCDALLLNRVEDGFLQRRDMAGTGLGLTFAARDGSSCRISVAGANQTLDLSVLDRPELWTWVGMVLVQTELPDTVNLAVAQAARHRNIPVMLNVGGERDVDPALLTLITHLVLEGDNLPRLGAEPADTAEALGKRSEELLPTLVGLVILGGSAGQFARDRGRSFSLPGTRPDQTPKAGAVDAFCGTLAAALARGLPLEPACLLARKAML